MSVRDKIQNTIIIIYMNEMNRLSVHLHIQSSYPGGNRRSNFS